MATSELVKEYPHAANGLLQPLGRIIGDNTTLCVYLHPNRPEGSSYSIYEMHETAPVIHAASEKEVFNTIQDVLDPSRKRYKPTAPLGGLSYNNSFSFGSFLYHLYWMDGKYSLYLDSCDIHVLQGETFASTIYSLGVLSDIRSKQAEPVTESTAG